MNKYVRARRSNDIDTLDNNFEYYLLGQLDDSVPFLIPIIQIQEVLIV